MGKQSENEAPALGEPVGDKAPEDAASLATQPSSDSHMEQLRHLLFGEQMREYRARFDELDERLSAEIGRLRDGQQARDDALGALIRGEIQRLGDAQQRDRDARHAADQEMLDRLEALSRDLGARLEALQAALADETEAREAALASKASELTDALDERIRGLDSLLREERDRLQGEKTGREELARLFGELAARLDSGADGA